MQEILVTDHALIRWIERVHNIDLNSFREEIRSIVKNGVELGIPAVPNNDGFWYLIDKTNNGHKVVTIMSDEMYDKRKRRGDIRNYHHKSIGRKKDKKYA